MNTNELRVMKYHEAVNGPDSELWKAKVKSIKEWLTVVFLRKSREVSFRVE
jgi:hypothetical protein